MKKIISLLLTFLLIVCPSLSAYAADYSGEVTPGNVLLINADDGKELYAKEADSQVYPASTTKLMTALVVMDQCSDLDAEVTVNADDVSDIVFDDDSTLEPMLSDGEIMTVRNLLYGMLIVSGSDAANVLARYSAGSISDFVELMNEKAVELGMDDTHYANPHGRQDENHYTTPRDMAKLAQAVYQNETLMEIVGTASYTIPATNLSEARSLISTNRLLCNDPEKPDENGYIYSYATGMKTGSTPYAYGCLVASAAKGDVHLICLVFDDETENELDRFSLSRKLFEYGFEQYYNYDGDNLLADVSVSLPKKLAKKYDVSVDYSGFSYTSQSEISSKDITANVDFDEESLSGTVTYLLNKDQVLAEYPLVVTEKSSTAAAHPVLHGIFVFFAVLSALVLLLAAAVLVLNFKQEQDRKTKARKRQMRGLFPYSKKPNESNSSARAREERRQKKMQAFLKKWEVIGAVSLILLILCIGISAKLSAVKNVSSSEDVSDDTEATDTSGYASISAEATDSTSPSTMGVTWNIITEDSSSDDTSGSNDLSILDPSTYFSLPGICTFRGNNFRNDATYGTASVSSKSFSELQWSVQTGSLSTSSGTSAWTGSGWTGQPLVVQWDSQTKSIMNLYEDKKEKENLTEIIYATLDGHIYFIDKDDGSYTRDPLDLGMCFKGAGALDPRGYPLMYVGSGDATVDGTKPHIYVISLIDGTVLYTYGSNDPDSLRTDHDNWSAFDSSPLVDGEHDTLIWPGENGILYTIKLNTLYDQTAGTISVTPEIPVKSNYTTTRSNEDTYWLGMEASADIIDHYLYISENGGMFYCVDLNTMQLVWAQDTIDDSNSSPVVDYDSESGTYSIFTAPSLHWTADDDSYGNLSIYKLNAENGEIEWTYDYSCYTVDGVSGGVQATPLLGRDGSAIEDTIIYPLARTPNISSGELVALDTETGQEKWKFDMDNYAWSSPVAVYDDDGNAYVVIFDSAGYGYLLDGQTGELLDTVNCGSMIEASPVVFENTIIVGTRGMQICCFTIE